MIWTLLQWQNVMSVDGSMKHIIGKEDEFVNTRRDELFAGHLEKRSTPY